MAKEGSVTRAAKSFRPTRKLGIFVVLLAVVAAALLFRGWSFYPLSLDMRVEHDDYRVLSLSLKAHPLSLLRPRLDRRHCTPSERLAAVKTGSRVKVAGLVITRQRPGSANGVMFITIEDETGHANLIVWPTVFERFRQAVLGATVMGVEGSVQREGAVIHVVARRVWNLDPLLGGLTASARPGRAAVETKFGVRSRDFH